MSMSLLSNTYTSKATRRATTKEFVLHHCYKDLVGNEKWIRRNSETTPKRSQISIFVEANDKEDENPHKRPDVKNMAKERRSMEASTPTKRSFVL